MLHASRRVALVLLTGLALACGGSEPQAPPPAPAPEVRLLVLVSIDTLRADHLSAYGYPRETAPTLDALAAEGVLFEAAMSPSPWTLPAHGSMLTGLYPARHALTHDRAVLAEEIDTLAGVLSDEGFATAAVVNALYLNKRYGFDRGFDVYEYVHERVDQHGTAREITDRALAWLEAGADPALRRFLFVHYFDVHSDYNPSPRFLERFARGRYDGEVDGSTAQLDAWRREARSPSDDEAQRLRDLYDAEILELDAELARLLGGVEGLGPGAQSLVVVTSDHGEEFGEHGSVLHGRTHYEEMLHVPLILRGPGLPAGARVALPVSLVDLMPTLLGRLGVAVPPGLDGVDLGVAWSGDPGALAGRDLFGEADHGPGNEDVGRAVRRGSFKLHLDRASGARALYDLVRDPGEQEDLLERHPEMAAELEAALERHEAGRVAPTRAAPLDPEEMERLRALGYGS